MSNQTLPQVGQPSQLVGCIPDGLPVPDRKAFGELDTLLERYYALNGIVDADVVGEEQAAEDCDDFAHLRTPGSVEFGATVQFMHEAASDLPRGWCVTWAYLDEFAQVQAGVLSFPDMSREVYLETLFLVAVGQLKASHRNGAK